MWTSIQSFKKLKEEFGLINPNAPFKTERPDYNLVCLLLTTHFQTQNSFSSVFKKAIEKPKRIQKLFPLHILSLCSWVPNNAKEVKIQIKKSKTYSYCSDQWCPTCIHTKASTLLNPLNKVLSPRKEIAQKKSRQWWCLACFFIYLFLHSLKHPLHTSHQ